MIRLTRRRLAAALAACTAALAAAIAIGLVLDVDTGGGRHLRLLSFWMAGSADETIFFQFRLPRVLAGAVCGAGLAAAGCAFQALLRNPLAEPYTLGISSGSALAAVLAIRLGLDQTVLGHSGIGLAALAGSAATVWVVYRLGRVGRSLPPATLLLGGITVAMFCSAASMLVQYTADFSEIYKIIRWMMGGLDAVAYGPLARTAAGIGLGSLLLVLLARPLNALAAGEDAAASVGVDPRRTMAIAFATASLVVGATIALAGPIGFIGLLVPHALRALVGPDHRVLLPTSMLAGAALLVLCDTVAREALAPDQIPVGIVTALFGGPFFLYLLLREKGRGRLWGGG